MEAYEVFKSLAIIIVAAKLFGILARRFKAPQVAGEIIAGLIIGPSVLGLVSQTEFLTVTAEIGVVLLMFSAGLETDLKDLTKTGPLAFLIACAGVIVPLLGGSLIYTAFYGMAPWGSEKFYEAVFIGVVTTATSVSITVQVLKELGKLKGKVGTTIVSAAIIDDVIGIIVLTFIIGLKNPEKNPAMVLVSTALFFACSAVIGFILYKIFREVSNVYPHTRRIPIMGLALCLFLAYAAEEYFGIADITGAYVAGIILCSITEAEYIAEKMDINSYMFFGPIFFASIGLKTSIEFSTPGIIWFSIAFVIVGLLTKTLGCGLMAKICGFNWGDSLKIGVGMMNRGEVALIVAQKGLTAGLLSPIYFTSVILLIIISSIATPIALKLLYVRSE